MPFSFSLQLLNLQCPKLYLSCIVVEQNILKTDEHCYRSGSSFPTTKYKFEKIKNYKNLSKIKNFKNTLLKVCSIVCYLVH